MRFPVTIEVPEGGGRTRRVSAETIIVSHAGATLELDENIPTEAGIQVTPPFGGAILAEVTDSWIDRSSGRRRVSIRLIDPTSWTAPERLAGVSGAGRETGSLCLNPRAWQMLDDYALYLSERDGDDLTAADAAERIIEEMFLSNENFQNWFAAKIMEDLQAWEETSVMRG